jgi:squalene-associated FAD-dependent desaturase
VARALSDGTSGLRVAVVGGGWAGLAAAVRATESGHAVTLLEMSRNFGGRARSVERAGQVLDNGQHILIGAYHRTLALMQTVGVDPDAVLARMPLTLVTPNGQGLRLPAGSPALAFLRAVLVQRAWRPAHKFALLTQAAAWAVRGFRCAPDTTVAALCRALPDPVCRDLIEPLCVAALNTPADEASGQVFLRVMRDALFSGAGSADLLLPRKPLGELLPDATLQWLMARGATVSPGRRVQQIEACTQHWEVDGDRFDAVVIACTAAEAARLSAPHNSSWATLALALRYEPIVTVTVKCPGARMPAAMVSLPAGPAQFVFDHGAIGATPGRFTAVISGAQAWVEGGMERAEAAVLLQLQTQFEPGTWPVALAVEATLSERRATFRCTPSLQRPGSSIAPRLVAAGDYVAGPYPATLEGAVRSGEAAAVLATRAA